MIRKLILLCLLLATSLSLKAQNWGRGIDDEDFNWGFAFQYVSPELKLTKNKDWRRPFYETQGGVNRFATDSLSSISSSAGAGFGIGLVLNKKISSNVDLRFTPTITFSDRSVDYTYQLPLINNPDLPSKNQKVSPSLLDFPLGLKLKSDRLGNFRAYLIGNLKFSHDLASAKYTDEDKIAVDKKLKNSRDFFSYEAGFGVEFYFEYFKMSPEIKMGHSFGDVLKHDANNPYSTPIDKAILRNFTFSLFFE